MDAGKMYSALVECEPNPIRPKPSITGALVLSDAFAASVPPPTPVAAPRASLEAKTRVSPTSETAEQARANLARARSDLTGAGVDLLDAQQKYSRAKALADQQLELQSDLDAAAIAVDEARASQKSQQASVAQAEAAVGAADASVTQNQINVDHCIITAPIDGIVDTRAVRIGEVVNPGQPIVTLINPDDLWVRADVEESYIDRVKIGDTLAVRLPSGAERSGVVFYRGVDAAYATQRDVSRTKRDIKTFEIRLRVNNDDRRLAVGMTAYVLLPVAK